MFGTVTCFCDRFVCVSPVAILVLRVLLVATIMIKIIIKISYEDDSNT